LFEGGWDVALFRVIFSSSFSSCSAAAAAAAAAVTAYTSFQTAAEKLINEAPVVLFCKTNCHFCVK
jgi:hypothetical protein